MLGFIFITLLSVAGIGLGTLCILFKSLADSTGYPEDVSKEDSNIVVSAGVLILSLSILSAAFGFTFLL